jgi:hypothetical protein
MIRRLCTLCIVLMLGVSAILPIAAFAESSPSFSLSVDKSSPVLGEEILVEVNGNQLTDLFGNEVHLTFDSSRLEFKGAVSSLGGYAITPIVKENTIQLAHTLVGAIPGRSGDMTLYTLTFKTTSVGPAPIQLSSLQMLDSQLVSRSVTGVAKVTPVIGSTNTEPTPPPTPTPTPTSTPTSTTEPISNPGAIPAATPAFGDGKSVVLKPEVKLNPESLTATASIDLATWTKTLEQAGSGNKDIRIIVADVQKAKAYVLELPSEAISGKKTKNRIQVETPLATIFLPNDMFPGTNLPAYVGLYAGKVDINGLNESMKARIGSHPVIELGIQAGGETIAWSNPTAPVTVSISYKPTAEELLDPEHIVVWYLDGNGQVIPVPNGKFDSKTGQVTFSATHFGKYAAAFVKKTFDDIASLDWATKQIEVLASKGIINGISDRQFDPDRQVTRADFLLLLIRVLELQGIPGSRFADVQEDDYYNEALRIARGMGIVQGNGDNKFNPQASITREDMIVMTQRALKAAQHISGGTTAATQSAVFADMAEVSDYARDSILELSKMGLIQGDGHGIYPKYFTTRAEAAVLIYNIYYLNGH